MSDVWQGPGWWRATDGKWYPPHEHPDYAPEPAALPNTAELQQLSAGDLLSGNRTTPSGAAPRTIGLPPTGESGVGGPGRRWLLGLVVVVGVVVGVVALASGSTKATSGHGAGRCRLRQHDHRPGRSQHDHRPRRSHIDHGTAEDAGDHCADASSHQRHGHQMRARPLERAGRAGRDGVQPDDEQLALLDRRERVGGRQVRGVGEPSGDGPRRADHAVVGDRAARARGPPDPPLAHPCRRSRSPSCSVDSAAPAGGVEHCEDPGGTVGEP